MATTNVFAFRNAGLDAFLQSDVGVEPGGATLTMLSALARLGEDPWAVASRWSAMPRAVARDGVLSTIRQMELTAPSLAQADATASTLIGLLPAPSPALNLVRGRGARLPAWVLMAFLAAALAAGWAVRSAVMQPTPQQTSPSMDNNGR